MAHRVGPGEEASRGFSLSQSISKADLESQNTSVGVPFMAQQLTNPTRILMRTLVRSLVSLSGLRIRCCHELWCRLAAIARIRPLVWELPNAEGLALKRKKKKIPVCLHSQSHWPQSHRTCTILVHTSSSLWVGAVNSLEDGESSLYLRSALQVPRDTKSRYSKKKRSLCST